MRAAHRNPLLCAVANGRRLSYDVGMKTNALFHSRSNTAPPRNDRRPFPLNQAHAPLKKALERWENEGGRIPEVAAGNGRKAAERGAVGLTAPD
jgi:hypothetical protein